MNGHPVDEPGDLPVEQRKLLTYTLSGLLTGWGGVLLFAQTASGDPNSGQDTDYTGYDFWLTKLNQFNGNFQNADMVKAFITSAEYRRRSGPN